MTARVGTAQYPGYGSSDLYRTKVDKRWKTWRFRFTFGKTGRAPPSASSGTRPATPPRGSRRLSFHRDVMTCQRSLRLAKWGNTNHFMDPPCHQWMNEVLWDFWSFTLYTTWNYETVKHPCEMIRFCPSRWLSVCLSTRLMGAKEHWHLLQQLAPESQGVLSDRS